MSFLVAPSILSADFSRLGEEVRDVERAGADWIHVDVMDGHFVPNLTIGAPVVKSLRPITRLPLDVHLMIEHPEKYIEDFARAGADYITFHIEATTHPRELIAHIHKLGCKAGLTLKPGTSLEEVLPFVERVQLLLVMTVEPGFGGQSFMHDQVKKIQRLRQEIESTSSSALIEVDGGINEQMAGHCRDADVLVAGSYIFKNDYKKAISQLHNA